MHSSVFRSRTIRRKCFLFYQIPGMHYVVSVSLVCTQCCLCTSKFLSALRVHSGVQQTRRNDAVLCSVTAASICSKSRTLSPYSARMRCNLKWMCGACILLSIPRLPMPSFLACTEGVEEILEMFRHDATAGTASVHCEYRVKAHAYRLAC